MTAGACVFVVFQIKTRGAASFWTSGQLPFPGILLGVALAMPLNLGLEVWKWKRLMGAEHSWANAWREVLGGAALGFFTPNRAGDVVARVSLLPAALRENGMRAYLTSAASQMWITLLGGTTAWIALPMNHYIPALPTELETAIGSILLACTIWSLWKFLRWHVPLEYWTSKWSWLHAKLPPTSIPIPWSLRLESIGYSGLRYVVFSAQLLGALHAWGYPTSLQTTLEIPVIWLGNMAVPSGALAEMGVREVISLLVLQPVPTELWSVVWAPFSVWMVNLAIPAVAGTWIGTQRKHGS